MICKRHGETRHDPYTAECLECLAITPRCAGLSGGCGGLGDPDPAAHDPNECLQASEKCITCQGWQQIEGPVGGLIDCPSCSSGDAE